ncbi:MAG: hypothetical protein WBV45_03155 [Lutimonas sp.]
MPHQLKNKNLTVLIDLPEEGYSFSRFDWTGKIRSVTFRNLPVSGRERPDARDEDLFGQGFYNEFGIDTALGFEEAEMGGWFHKIGIGLLKKNNPEYLFHKEYEIRPAQFGWHGDTERIVLTCTSEANNGYSYVLEKEISLKASGFTIQYRLQNVGDKKIRTQEYIHNFMAIDEELISSDYELRFPFEIKPEAFGETVNPEGRVKIGSKSVSFSDTPNEQFFLSNLSGGDKVKASWELIHSPSQVGIRETGSFQTGKINLWGWRHVISPELFVQVDVDQGQSAEWSRNYEVFSTGG